jgi:16S rRNA G527 N7-methylase RsmG
VAEPPEIGRPRAPAYDPFAGMDLEACIRGRAARCALDLDEDSARALAFHARAVLRESVKLHLTTITEPAEFVERHLGESFEGAAMLPPDVRGQLLDMGSGNGYPGLVVATARNGLEALLAEASTRKAEFLRAVVRNGGFLRTAILEGQVQRASDLDALGPFRVISSRAVGGWTKILPRLAPCLAPDGELLVWSGEDLERISHRVVWRRLRLIEKKPLPGRERSWVWRFGAA